MLCELAGSWLTGTAERKAYRLLPIRRFAAGGGSAICGVPWEPDALVAVPDEVVRAGTCDTAVVPPVSDASALDVTRAWTDDSIASEIAIRSALARKFVVALMVLGRTAPFGVVM